MVLPLLKLGTLALKTLSKPVANRLKKQAAVSPRFRELIISIARYPLIDKGINLGYGERFKFFLFISNFYILGANHQITTKMQRRIYGHATNVEIRPLNETKAVQAAADLIGELFVFTVAGAALIFEVQRSARSEARKEEMRKQELEAMRQRDEELQKEVELLRRKVEELEQLAKGQGLSGLFKFKHTTADTAHLAKAA